MDELRRQKTFESAEESQTRYVSLARSFNINSSLAVVLAMTAIREIVLGRIAKLIQEFVKKVSLEQGLSEAAATAAGGKIYTFGSYRLGVHSPGSDIDTLCVVPKHISREDFFETYENMLRATDGVTEVSVSLCLCLYAVKKLPDCARREWRRHMCRL